MLQKFDSQVASSSFDTAHNLSSSLSSPNPTRVGNDNDELANLMHLKRSYCHSIVDSQLATLSQFHNSQGSKKKPHHPYHHSLPHKSIRVATQSPHQLKKPTQPLLQPIYDLSVAANIALNKPDPSPTIPKLQVSAIIALAAPHECPQRLPRRRPPHAR